MGRAAVIHNVYGSLHRIYLIDDCDGSSVDDTN